MRGTLLSPLLLNKRRQDHPRLCGEHALPVATSAVYPGSPPLMRGTRRRCSRRSKYSRITPAYAGNTRRAPGELRTPQDHPRLCGEHNKPYNLWLYFLGSPPLMRGTHSILYTCLYTYRITPAYAGNTIEYSRALYDRGGSPPLMRGTHSPFPLSFYELGITPAYAGNTRVCCTKLLITEDHPRLCGEHSLYAFFPLYRQGSPPLMRGTLSLGLFAFRFLRITPAYAGNTSRQHHHHGIS